MTPVDVTYDVKRILCAVDHSEPSLRAVKLALDLAGKCKAELTLLSVVRLPDRTQQPITEYLQHEHIHDAPGVVVCEAAQNDLCLLRDQATMHSCVSVNCEVRAGEAITEIVSSARDLAIDLIVVGHRSHGRVSGILLGSTARSVIELAPCPVLVVR
jgi:nucleotide-binding universal stress UspA family protein